jgi:hypothetical protein
MASRATALRAYRIVGALAALVAVGYQLTREASVVECLSYFTILSNLFAGAILLTEGLRGGAGASIGRSANVDLLRGAIVVYMLTTGIVDNVMYDHVFAPWVDAIVHQIMPVVVLLDWIIDPPRTRLAVRSTMLWLSFPLAYIAFILIRGSLVKWWPYYFFNPTHSAGYLGVLGSALGIGVGIIALILLTTWIGNSRRAPLIEPLPAGGLSAH